MFLGRYYCLTALAGLSLFSGAEGFASTRRCCAQPAQRRLHMGLYDTPLPPPPPRQEKPIKDEDDDFQETMTERLFEFGMDGKEVRDLLPPLKRRLNSGVDCYFEPTDRLVKNLVEKTSVNPEDACWALEACQGDITEAWTRISTARRMNLDKSRMNALREDYGYDSEDYDMEVLNEYEQRKLDRRTEMEKLRRNEYFKLSKTDDQWLPTTNPRPVDDEPWFTG